jgi:hypothetical protein
MEKTKTWATQMAKTTYSEDMVDPEEGKREYDLAVNLENPITVNQVGPQELQKKLRPENFEASKRFAEMDLSHGLE